MSSQRHAREFHFELLPDANGDPVQPTDSAEETAPQYDEVASWPDGDRPGDNAP